MRSILPTPRRVLAALSAAIAIGLPWVPPAAAQAGCADPVPEDQWSAPQPLADEAMMIDLAKTGGALVAVGDRGYVLVSEDEGRTWTQQVTPTRSLLTAAWFANRDLGWVVGHDAVILRTRDGGRSWCRVHWAPDLEKPLFDVWFEDEENGFAVGAYGYFLRTSDGGDTWEEVVMDAKEFAAGEAGGEDEEAAGEDDYDEGYDDEESWDEDFNLGGDFHLNKIIVAGGDRLFLAAEAGTIYRSTDAGRTWSIMPSPYDGSFFSGIDLGGRSLLLFGLRGNLFRTDDDGETWRQIDLPVDNSLFGGARMDDGSVVVVGASGVMLVSREGESFRLVQRPDRKVLMTLQPAGDGIVLVGEPGVERLDRSALAAQ